MSSPPRPSDRAGRRVDGDGGLASGDRGGTVGEGVSSLPVLFEEGPSLINQVRCYGQRRGEGMRRGVYQYIGFIRFLGRDFRVNFYTSHKKSL